MKVKLRKEYNNFLILTGPGRGYRIHAGGEYSPNGFDITQEEYDKVFKNVVDVVDNATVSKVVVPIDNKEEIPVVLGNKKLGERKPLISKGIGKGE